MIGALCGAMLTALACLAAEPPPAVAPPPAKEAAAEESPVTTRHSISMGGRTLSYTATAGYLPLKDEAGHLQANIFFVAYSLAGETQLSSRPITFAFNGGPGSSSIWLHMGALGPRRSVLAGDGTELPQTFRLVDNGDTWLSFTDLVFVDPVGTGYSRAAEGVEAKRFYSTEKDIETAAQFIRLYVTRSGRWLSPKYVAGESYGTTRAAGLAGYLQEAAGMNINGVVLISSALSFQAFSCASDNDIAYVLAIPTFAATAAYHKKASSDLAQVEQWALGDYVSALAKGDALSPEERGRVAKKLSEYTGLPAGYLERRRLRVSPTQFIKELLSAEGRITGLMDGRVASVDEVPWGEETRYDPGLFVATGPFVATLNDYLRRDLGFETNLPYEFLSSEVGRAWEWTPQHGQGYVYTARDLAQAMARDEHFRVFSAAGQYDLTTPYLGQKYVLEHMGLDPSRRKNLTFQTYPSGHQLYTDSASRKKLHDDVEAFMAGTP